MTHHDTALHGLQDLLDRLRDLRREVREEGRELYEEWCPLIERKVFRLSALNLAYYLALRCRDLRPIQTELTRWGLSSLGRSEGRVIPNIDAVIATIEGICGCSDIKYPRLHSVSRGQRLLRRETEAVFGAVPEPRKVYIMVTMPTEAAYRYDLMCELVKRGMNCIRINSAHDTPEHWEAMIANLRRAEAELGRACKVLFDLGGPKPRTAEVVISTDQERLFKNDRILLTRGAPHLTKAIKFSARCTLPEIFDQLRLGARVWIDDGKIGGAVEDINPEGVVVCVTHARSKGERLREAKGINFPDTNLTLSPLTDKDLQDLDFAVQHADLIGYSFVQSAADVQLLQSELAKRTDQPKRIAIVAKVETNRAVRNLPEIIIQAAGRQPLAVMIARGDLAVELGYERLAEIQEELLWMCEAAHVPVIWATQVLERAVTKGVPSRSEMTDAAMAARAECVMLNKGPYVADAVSLLDDVLTRMRVHQTKKSPHLRALHSWAEFVLPDMGAPD